jgi:hypothetical protein
MASDRKEVQSPLCDTIYCIKHKKVREVGIACAYHAISSRLCTMLVLDHPSFICLALYCPSIIWLHDTSPRNILYHIILEGNYELTIYHHQRWQALGVEGQYLFFAYLLCLNPSLGHINPSRMDDGWMEYYYSTKSKSNMKQKREVGSRNYRSAAGLC